MKGVDLLEKSFEDKNNRLKAFVMDISNEEQVENARTYICDELELLKMGKFTLVCAKNALFRHATFNKSDGCFFRSFLD